MLATQTGYQLGGLVVIEALFGIQGLGNLVLDVAKSRDFPMLHAGVMVMATILCCRPLQAISSAPCSIRGNAAVCHRKMPMKFPVREALGWHPSSPILESVLQLSPSVIVGSLILLFWICCAAFGQLFVPYDPYAVDFLVMLAPPDAAHWFGTDQLGRDVLSRIVIGSRDCNLAECRRRQCAWSSAWGFRRTGRCHRRQAGRHVDGLPFIVLVTMTLVALGPCNLTVILVIGIAYARLVARTVSAAVNEQHERDCVSAARLGGESSLAIIFLEISPNVREIILLEMLTRLGYAFFSIATLSFLGLGIQPVPQTGGSRWLMAMVS